MGKSKLRGVPTRQTSTLSSSDLPTGTDSCGVLGKLISKALRGVCNALNASSAAFNSSPRWAISAMMALRINSESGFETNVRVGKRSTGAVLIIDKSRTPVKLMFNVRGIGVADNVKVSTAVFIFLIFSL